MTRPATISEWMTIAVPTVVGDVLKLATIPPTETRRALMLKDIRIWAIATTIIGSQEVRSSGLWPVIETASVVNSVAPENWWAADWAPFVRSALTWGSTGAITGSARKRRRPRRGLLWRAEQSPAADEL